MRSLSFAFILVLVASSSAGAATLNVSGGGQLLGASGVIVDGNSYNVEFLDGTCIALYNGCDDVSDFTFQTSGAADLAANALLDQVFRNISGIFDFHVPPNLTAGCYDPIRCIAWTPYAIETDPAVESLSLLGAHNLNEGLHSNFQVTLAGTGWGVGRATDTTARAEMVYAVWSVGVVPEPGTGVLMGLGLLGLSVSNRRQR